MRGLEQTVSVRENATYRLTARVMAENCGEEHKGANVSFSGIYGTSADLHDTAGQWETLTLYARTGKGQREVTVMARLGGYGSENSGKALVYRRRAGAGGNGARRRNRA